MSRLLPTLLCSVLLSTAPAGLADERDVHNPDPWEGLNRKVYIFNDYIDRNLLVPTARAYQWITPDPVQRGVRNVIDNLLEVTTVANGLLQGKFSQATSDTGRFLVNSTVGVLGVFDVASRIGLERHDEDLGQTLGYWGVPSGPFVVVPFFGPFTVRDGLAFVVDTSTTDYLANLDDVRTRNSVTVLRFVSLRADLLKSEDLISGDRYSFIRDAYLQRREYLVRDGKVEDTFGDEDYEEDWDEW
ncbi:MAG: VacJ family lipoprotein [Spongiibacteraceae bacterium]|jgi:phospholipid-binding lipoprotein MlaA|nr:VacJ family lipoprotein [Spongiibacteraceae bacterium]